MRTKIIVVNAAIVLLVGLLSYAILLTTLSDSLSDRNSRALAAEHATRSANAQLALDAARAERWLEEYAQREALRALFELGTAHARSEAATAQANSTLEATLADASFAGIQPALALVVDSAGVALGRNNSTTLMRGENIAEHYPALLTTLKDGRAVSTVWLSPERQEQLLISHVAIRGAQREVLGALILGTPLNDDRLERVSQLTSGEPLAFVVRRSDGTPEWVAHTRSVSPEVLKDATNSAAAIIATSESRRFQVLDGKVPGRLLGMAPLAGYSGVSAVLVSAVLDAPIVNLPSLLWPVLAVTLLGLLLVVIAGNMVAAYISRPISELEEGLLTVINGKTDLRFELEHEELGGLVFRINSLLNSLTGVAEPASEANENGDP
jgi:hypothetical protein